MHHDRIRQPEFIKKMKTGEEAARIFKSGMTIEMSGFTRAGNAKVMPLAERTRRESLQLTLVTGVSLGNGSEGLMTSARLLARRLPFKGDATLHRKINDGEVMFIDQHLSETAERLRSHSLVPVDLAVIEAVTIIEDGGIIATMAVGNSASFVQQACSVTIEIKLGAPRELEGLHDIYLRAAGSGGMPITPTSRGQRIGAGAIVVEPARVVITDSKDSPSTLLSPDEEIAAIAWHIIAFFNQEIAAGGMAHDLLPLQAGIEIIANAVLHGPIDSRFHNLTMYSEVLRDSAIELLDSGQLNFASASSITLSATVHEKFIRHLRDYIRRTVLRPQEISNHPEIVRRLGLIALNTALEFDTYGNLDFTHFDGTRMINGIGSSGDFGRNSRLSLFVRKSVAMGGNKLGVVPMVSHGDHSEHDVDILVTEWGLSNLRGLPPRERAPLIIKCYAHPDYRPQLRACFERAVRRGVYIPHLLKRAFCWHSWYQSTKTMLRS